MFWRDEPLNQEEENLLGLLRDAHNRSAYRQNASSIAVINAWSGSHDIGKAIAAAIMTIGGNHAPLFQTAQFLKLEYPDREVGPILKSGNKVPGWGGTFQHFEPDPLWSQMHEALRESCPELSAKIATVTSALHVHGKKIYPNPSAYTAAVALALGLPPELASWLFIRSRLDAWAHIAWQNGGKT